MRIQLNLFLLHHDSHFFKENCPRWYNTRRLHGHFSRRPGMSKQLKSAKYADELKCLTERNRNLRCISIGSLHLAHNILSLSIFVRSPSAFAPSVQEQTLYYGARKWNSRGTGSMVGFFSVREEAIKCILGTCWVCLWQRTRKTLSLSRFLLKNAREDMAGTLRMHGLCWIIGHDSLYRIIYQCPYQAGQIVTLFPQIFPSKE